MKDAAVPPTMRSTFPSDVTTRAKPTVELTNTSVKMTGTIAGGAVNPRVNDRMSCMAALAGKWLRG